jgi:nucleotide-binding universal stress UspA family protein
MFAKILVALDDTAFASTILEEAMQMAQKFDAELLLFHVLSPISASYYAGFQPGNLGISGYMPDKQVMQQYDLEWRAHEEHSMAQLQGHRRLAAERGVKVECWQSHGGSQSPGRSICDTAQQWCADLILMGRNRRSTISELFLGSTSNYVLHNAPCSVLVVQAPVAASQTVAPSALS